MMGANVRLVTPIAAPSLDELVPADHFYRQLDHVLDLSFVRNLVQDHYAAGVGRPSVDPVVFFKLALMRRSSMAACIRRPHGRGVRPDKPGLHEHSPV
jgi:hypothetical protein